MAYDALKVLWQDSRFIEEETLPCDAQVVGQTWKHPNKNGGRTAGSPITVSCRFAFTRRSTCAAVTG